MDKIEFDVELQLGELYRFTMRHTYHSISGIFSLCISIGSLLVCVCNLTRFTTSTLLALLVIGLLFTVVQPLMLLTKCAAQIKQNKNINAPLHYTISQEGVQVSQGEQVVLVKWYEIRKSVFTKKGIYLYMSPVRAFIFPRKQCEESFEPMEKLIREQMEKYKDYIPPEEEESLQEEGKDEQ